MTVYLDRRLAPGSNLSVEVTTDGVKIYGGRTYEPLSDAAVKALIAALPVYLWDKNNKEE